jgi:hypothetical protein
MPNHAIMRRRAALMQHRDAHKRSRVTRVAPTLSHEGKPDASMNAMSLNEAFIPVRASMNSLNVRSAATPSEERKSAESWCRAKPPPNAQPVPRCRHADIC